MAARTARARAPRKPPCGGDSSSSTNRRGRPRATWWTASRRSLPRVKVGHAGTLDPLASGILVVCIGAATRLIEIIQHLSKSYRTVIRLGARSDTHDALG